MEEEGAEAEEEECGCCADRDRKRYDQWSRDRWGEECGRESEHGINGCRHTGKASTTRGLAGVEESEG